MAGLTELGFALAAYLSLQDAVREAARFGADGDPCGGADPYDPAVTCTEVNGFFQPIATRFDQAFGPYTLDPGQGDDLVISAFGIYDNGTLAWRLPKDHPNGWARFNNRNSRISAADLQAIIGHRPSKGLLVVEAFYHYRQRLGLFVGLLPDPIPMYAIAWMPLPSVDPMQ